MHLGQLTCILRPGGQYCPQDAWFLLPWTDHGGLLSVRRGAGSITREPGIGISPLTLRRGPQGPGRGRHATKGNSVLSIFVFAQGSLYIEWQRWLPSLVNWLLLWSAPPVHHRLRLAFGCVLGPALFEGTIEWKISESYGRGWEA